MSNTKNLAASLSQRLLNEAIRLNRPFPELLQRYANERFLVRLVKSPHGRHFILKEALTFLAWNFPVTRPTRDIDLLGYTGNSVENLIRIVQEVCVLSVDPDGVVFDPQSVTGERIIESAKYEGVRVSFLGYLGRSRIPMRLDVGFADHVSPDPHTQSIPTVFPGMEQPIIRVYPPETVIAEKFQTMVALSEINSRMKDYFDIWCLAMTKEFDRNVLMNAIVGTFQQRSTSLPSSLSKVWSLQYIHDKQADWVAFLKKNQLNGPPEAFQEIVQTLSDFLTPLFEGGSDTKSHWRPELQTWTLYPIIKG